MEDISHLKISPGKLRSFVRHVCIVAKKQRDREIAKQNLNNQIVKIKKVSSNPKKFSKELQKLEQKISDVLDKERELLKLGKKDREEIEKLKSELESTKRSRDTQFLENKTKIEKVGELLLDLKSDINKFVTIRTARQKRINELENKIRSSAKPEKHNALRLKVERLEAKHKSLMKKTKNKSELARIKERLDMLKSQLA